MTCSQDIDVHFNAIRQKFDNINQELEEVKNERDEYKRNCIVLYFLVDDNLTLIFRFESSKRTTGTSTKSLYCWSKTDRLPRLQVMQNH